MMAFHYILEQQVLHQPDIPLLSASDIRQLIAHMLLKQLQQDDILKQIRKRHQKGRPISIDTIRNEMTK